MKLINFLTVVLVIAGLGAWLLILGIGLALDPPAVYAKPAPITPVAALVFVLGLVGFTAAMILDRLSANRHAETHRDDDVTVIHVRSTTDEGELDKIVVQSIRMDLWISGNDRPQKTRIEIDGAQADFRHVDGYFRSHLAHLLRCGGDHFQVKFKQGENHEH